MLGKGGMENRIRKVMLMILETDIGERVSPTLRDFAKLYVMCFNSESNDRVLLDASALALIKKYNLTRYL